jgi:hypothetical protein
MAATLYIDTLYIKLNCQHRNVFVREIKETLLTDFFAPPGMIPLFDLVPPHPQWLY